DHVPGGLLAREMFVIPLEQELYEHHVVAAIAGVGPHRRIHVVERARKTGTVDLIATSHEILLSMNKFALVQALFRRFDGVAPAFIPVESRKRPRTLYATQMVTDKKLLFSPRAHHANTDDAAAYRHPGYRLH